MEVDLLICNALRPDCEVMWPAVAAIGSILAAGATAWAAYSAGFAAKAALEIDLRAIEREKGRERRDAVPLAVAIEKEIGMAIAVTVLLGQYEIKSYDTQDEIDRTMAEWQAMLSLSVTHSALDRLGCFAEETSAAVARTATDSAFLVQTLRGITFTAQPGPLGKRVIQPIALRQVKDVAKQFQTGAVDARKRLRAFLGELGSPIAGENVNSAAEAVHRGKS